MQSLSRRFQLSLGVLSLIVTVLATIGAFLGFQRELSNRQIAYLADYVKERSNNVDRRFSNLVNLQRSAGAELEQRMSLLSAADVERLLDRYMPLQADGSRRSRPQYFDGEFSPSGDYTYGMGAMLMAPSELSPLQKKALAASFDLVSNFGQAARGDYDNFYFFTRGTRLVMFGPDRPDRLMFYRKDAPPDLDISGEEMSYLTLPANNPSGATRCTNLQRLLQDEGGERLATACMTPAFFQGRYIGSFGSSIELTGFFLNVVKAALPGSSNLVVTDKGELIAYPGFESPGKASEATVAEYERRLGLHKLVNEIKANGAPQGVIMDPNRDEIVAYGRLSGPDWYLLLTYPRSAVAWSAARSASWVLVLGFIASIAQTMLVIALARRTIVQPLRQLAVSCSPEAFGERSRPDVTAIEARRDEIGLLARTLRDEREQVEEVLASLEDRVRDRTAQLERANAEKSRFLANMSHELRTPLNGVIAISETLAGEQVTPRSRELAELIASSGRLLEQVLTDILDFSKIEAGEITLIDEPFSMTEVARRIAELHRATAEAKGLAFSWAVDPSADDRFVGDQVRLSQVLSNLLSNAVKFTEAGEVTLNVSADELGVLFTVADTGIGFDNEVKARLFRRFEQADASIRRRFGGTGLGLAITRSLVELMGGTIEVDSKEGSGSTFAVRVPLPKAAQAAAELSGETAQTFNLGGLRVLLAEDHPTNQKVVQLILESVGVEPVIVENGALALAALKAERFDVVLMDMQMPDLDGLAATAMLRDLERVEGWPRTPVVMLTANALDEHVLASRQAGADLHLSKPIRAAALIEAVLGATLGERSQAGQALAG